MKPHEETWGDDYEVTVVGPRLERHEDIQREMLARAAPEMARVLLGVKDVLQQHPGLHRDVVDALTKAGVLP